MQKLRRNYAQINEKQVFGMVHQNARTERIMGRDALETLRGKKVAVFGVGGVGGYVTEALARCGIGTLELIDNDDIALTNLNRQIIATHRTLGMAKVEAFRERIHDINPEITVICRQTFYLPERAAEFDFGSYDFVVDAIDTVTAKLDIIRRCSEAGTPIISAMGCGNRMDPTKLVLTDIYKTQMDPLAKIIRHELKKSGIRKLPVVYSTEPPIQPLPMEPEEELPTEAAGECPNTPTSEHSVNRSNGTSEQRALSNGHSIEHSTGHASEPSGKQPVAGTNSRRSTPGSTPFVPSAAGLIIAAEVVRQLTNFDPSGRTKGGRQN